MLTFSNRRSAIRYLHRLCVVKILLGRAVEGVASVGNRVSRVVIRCGNCGELSDHRQVVIMVCGIQTAIRREGLWHGLRRCPACHRLNALRCVGGD